MSSSPKIKKILLLLQLTEIEEKEFKQIDRKFFREFDNDFRDEHDFLRRGKRKTKKTEKDQVSHELKVPTPPKIKKNDLKSIHRKLARVTHPDLNGDCSEDEFKKIQKAYDEGDGATLLKEAVRRKIEFKLEDDAYSSIKENLDTRRRNLEIKKSTIQWVWCTSNKDMPVRKKIQKIMGIDRSLFKVWINERNAHDRDKKKNR